VAYAGQDRPSVEKIVDDLRRSGLEVVWDQNTPSGQNWAEYLRRMITTSDFFAYVVSPNSVKSPQVLLEFGHAFGQRAEIHVIHLGGVTQSEAPPQIASVQWVDHTRLAPLVADILKRSASQNPNTAELREELGRVREQLDEIKKWLESVPPSLIHDPPNKSSAARTGWRYLGNKFEGVFDEILSLLVTVEQNDDLMLSMIATSPAFGLEMPPNRRSAWDRALRGSIVKGNRVRLLCLDPEDSSGSGSPVRRFCDSLARQLDQSAGRSATDFEKLAVESINTVRRLASSSGSKTEMKFWQEDIFQVVLVENPAGEGTGVVYFSSTNSITHHKAMNGYATNASEVLNFFRSLFNHFFGRATSSSHDTKPRVRRRK
jgi:hypothetical protein